MVSDISNCTATNGCTPGKFSPSSNGQGCQDCVAGRYKKSCGSSPVGQCLACPNGKFSSPRSAECTACPPGTWVDSGTTGQTNRSNCKLCPPGKFGDASPSGGTPNPCQSCGKGTYATNPVFKPPIEDGLTDYEFTRGRVMAVPDQQHIEGSAFHDSALVAKDGFYNGMLIVIDDPNSSLGVVSETITSYTLQDNNLSRALFGWANNLPNLSPGTDFQIKGSPSFNTSCEFCSAGYFNLCAGAQQCQPCNMAMRLDEQGHVGAICPGSSSSQAQACPPNGKTYTDQGQLIPCFAHWATLGSCPDDQNIAGRQPSNLLIVSDPPLRRGFQDNDDFTQRLLVPLNPSFAPFVFTPEQNLACSVPEGHELLATSTSAAGNSSVTQVSVVSVANLRIAVGDHIRIGSEIMKISGFSGNLLTVIRAQESTTAANFIKDAVVTKSGTSKSFAPCPVGRWGKGGQSPCKNCPGGRSTIGNPFGGEPATAEEDCLDCQAGKRATAGSSCVACKGITISPVS